MQERGSSGTAGADRLLAPTPVRRRETRQAGKGPNKHAPSWLVARLDVLALFVGALAPRSCPPSPSLPRSLLLALSPLSVFFLSFSPSHLIPIPPTPFPSLSHSPSFLSLLPLQAGVGFTLSAAHLAAVLSYRPARSIIPLPATATTVTHFDRPPNHQPTPSHSLLAHPTIIRLKKKFRNEPIRFLFSRLQPTCWDYFNDFDS